MKYNGALKGPVLATLFPTPNPTAGPPSGAGSNENPTLPGTNAVEIKNVTPGMLYAFAYLMVGAEHRQGPAPTDAVSRAPVPVTVTAGTTATVEIELFDPEPADGGADASDAADDG